MIYLTQVIVRAWVEAPSAAEALADLRTRVGGAEGGAMQFLLAKPEPLDAFQTSIGSTGMPDFIVGQEGYQGP